MNVQVTVSECTGIRGIAEGLLGLYPNPTEGVVNVKGMKSGMEYKVSDMLGREIMRGETEQIDLRNQAKGMYWVQLLYQGAVVYQGRLMKQ